MAEDIKIEINGKLVSLGNIVDVFVDGNKWFVDVYGEPLQEITYDVDEIIKHAPHLVDEEIIERRKSVKICSLIGIKKINASPSYHYPASFCGWLLPALLWSSQTVR